LNELLSKEGDKALNIPVIGRQSDKDSSETGCEWQI